MTFSLTDSTPFRPLRERSREQELRFQLICAPNVTIRLRIQTRSSLQKMKLSPLLYLFLVSRSAEKQLIFFMRSGSNASFTNTNSTLSPILSRTTQICPPCFNQDLTTERPIIARLPLHCHLRVPLSLLASGSLSQANTLLVQVQPPLQSMKHFLVQIAWRDSTSHLTQDHN
jgi:hypothetical protein